ncbi:hypothetical protein [Streptomyces sp. NPDC091217]|uniref:hypothetical protein n=1 Tax=Streptomyces sp. NPDC091217 TaxID=3365975 RepID=UPI00380AB7FE
MTEIDSSPLVLNGRRRSAARLRSGVLLLEQGGVRRRIPVAAIERVEVRGRTGRELAVVLTSNDPCPAAPGHSLVSRSAPAVREFAEALRRALPARDATEPRPDGASLVSVEPMERPGPEPRQVALVALGAGYALIAVALVARGAGEQAVVSWLVGVPLVLAQGVAALVGGVRRVRDAVVLRARGITVEGRLEYSYGTGSGEDAVRRHVYSYVDAHGVRRERDGTEGGAQEVEIVYDPGDPEGATKVGRGTGWQLTGGVFVAVLLGLPMTLVGLGMAASALAALRG